MLTEQLVKLNLIDKQGLVRTNAKEESGNPIRYTAEALLIQNNPTLINGLMALESPDFKGLYYKAPKEYGSHLDQVTQDDLVPLTHLFFKMGFLYESYLVLHRLKSRYGFYTTNPAIPLWRRFIGRNLSMVAHMYYAAGITPNAVLRFIHRWTINNCNMKDQDACVLTWHMVQVCPDPMLKAKFGVRFKAAWPGGMKDLLTKYFGWDHPLATFWKE